MVTARYHVSRHPLLACKMTALRDQTTKAPEFRILVRQLTQILFLEAIADLATVAKTIETPLADFPGVAPGERVGLMPILRAGLGMVDPILEMMPEACVWHLGLYRDHETLQPVTYYNKLPLALHFDLCLVLDPMLATGGSAIAAIDLLKRAGAKRVKFVGLIAAPEGIQALSSAHPEVAIHIGAVDSRLDERGYIVPGLGDAGDRQFGTL